MARPYHPPAPLTLPMGDNLDQRLSVLVNAINGKADQGVQGTAFPFLALIAPDGTTWRVLVDTAGVLSTELVPR